jgi:hypothetical protein
MDSGHQPVVDVDQLGSMFSGPGAPGHTDQYGSASTYWLTAGP